MKIRRLEANERYLANLCQIIAFEGNMDIQKAREECMAMTEEEIEKDRGAQSCVPPFLPSDPFPAIKRWAALTDDESAIQGCLNVNTYTARFDGHLVLMGGIGGVATLPQYRRSGCIRSCISAALQDMYDSGYAFSFLYPFSRAYYRKFGFEDGPRSFTWTIQMDAIASKPAPGTIRQLLPGDALEPLVQIYNRCFQDYNLSIVRKEYNPKIHLEELLSQQRYVYVWFDESGEPRGFFISKKNDKREMDCTATFASRNDFLAESSQALEAMLLFIKSAFSSDYDAIKFMTPEYISPELLLPECNKMSAAMQLNGMARIINVQKVLKLCRCHGNGTLCIAVSDNMLPHNNGTWKLSFAEGKENQVEITTDSPDITLSIQTLTSLICGIRSYREIPYLKDAVIHHPQAPLERVFYNKPCYVLDLF